ncbi:MAG: hypothetical protein ACUVX9_08035 [Anaerolineae bacterium]
MKRQLFLLLLIAFFVAACGEPPLSIEYHRTGGMATILGSANARDDHLTIDAQGNGRLKQLSQVNTFTLDKLEMDRLVAAFEKAEFTTLDAEYLAENHRCALMDYVIVYKGHKVHAMETKIPQQLQPVIDILDRIIWQYGRR